MICARISLFEWLAERGGVGLAGANGCGAGGAGGGAAEAIRRPAARARGAHRQLVRGSRNACTSGRSFMFFSKRWLPWPCLSVLSSTANTGTGLALAHLQNAKSLLLPHLHQFHSLQSGRGIWQRSRARGRGRGRGAGRRGSLWLVISLPLQTKRPVSSQRGDKKGC